MDNDILKLLGTEYSLSIANYRNGEYRIKVSNSNNQHAYRVFLLGDTPIFETKLPLNEKQKIRKNLQNYMLFLTIKACLSDLKQISKDLSGSNDFKTTKKDPI